MPISDIINSRLANSLSDNFKELHFYDYLIDFYDDNVASSYIQLREKSETYASFDSIDYIKQYFEECDHVICIAAQTNANIMNLFFYIDNKYCLRSTHDNNTIVNILRAYEKNLTKLCTLGE
jgi:translation initiation factor 2 gamma subunit (eIF-2gamma)